MAVAIDSNPGTSNAQNSNTINDYSGFTMGTGVSNPALVALVAWDNTGGITVSSVQWDIAGTPQSLTLIPGTSITNGANSSALYGRVGTITAGNKTVRLTISSAGNSYISLISFSGVDQTGGATSFPNGTSNTGTSTAASVIITSATGDAVVGAGCELNAGTITPDHTTVYNNTAGATVNGWGNEATGASTVTLGATFTSTSWSYSGTDIKAAGSARPFVSNVTGLPPVYSVPWLIDETWVDQGLAILPKLTVLPLNLHSNIRFYDLPPRDYTPKLSDYGFSDDTNTLLPIPTVLPTPLRTQSTALPPPPVTWYQNWLDNGNSILPKPTPFYPDIYNQWPNPPPVTWYQSWTQSFTLTNPTRQLDWPNPQPITWYQSWVQQGIRTVVQSPFVQSDWPLPQPVYWNLSWIDQGNSNLPTPTVLNTFRQSDWPNPQPIIWYEDWNQNLLENTLFQVFKPFVQTDWPLPKTYPPIDQFWSNDLNILPKPTPFFQNVDFPLPVVSQPIDQTWVQNLVNILLSTKPPNAQFDWPLTKAPQPIDQTWIQNLSEFYQANTFPFHQSNYPNPPPVYWYEDHNQNLVLYLPVGLKPTNQSDWPLTVAPQPIDQFYYQALALNLPPGPPPPVIQGFAGRQITPEEALRSWMSAIGAKGRVSRYGKL